MDDGSESRRLRMQLAERIAELMDEHHFSQYQLEELTGYDRSNFSNGRTGRRLISQPIAEACDTIFKTGTEIAERRWRAWQAKETERQDQKARRLGLPVTPPRNSGPQPISGPTVETREAETTDRRQFIGGLGGLGALTAAGDSAADLSRRLATPYPDPLTLEEMEADVDRITATYMQTRHDVLFPRVLAGWKRAEAALEGRGSLKARRKLTLFAGMYAFYLARLGLNTGDDVTARRFAMLAYQHGEDVGDPLLLGTVAGMRSSIAFYSGKVETSAEIAAQARPSADPYIQARLAAYEARARAAAGDEAGARAALDAMVDSLHDSGPRFGEPPFDGEAVEGFMAVVYGRLGGGTVAESHARRSLAILEGQGIHRPEDYGGSLAALSISLLNRPDPEPEEAARTVGRTLDLTAAYPTRTVVQRARELGQMLDTYRALPAIVEFRERLHEARTIALPTAG